MTITAYGPGDPQTWGPPTGHPNDPRRVDVYGECIHCECETENVTEIGDDFATFECEACIEDITRIENDPERAHREMLALHATIRELRAKS